MSATFEETYAAMMLAHVKREGHTPKMPPDIDSSKIHPYSKRINRMVNEGLTHSQIGKVLGLSRGRVSQIHKQSNG